MRRCASVDPSPHHLVSSDGVARGTSTAARGRTIVMYGRFTISSEFGRIEGRGARDERFSTT